MNSIASRFETVLLKKGAVVMAFSAFPAENPKPSRIRIRSAQQWLIGLLGRGSASDAKPFTEDEWRSVPEYHAHIPDRVVTDTHYGVWNKLDRETDLIRHRDGSISRVRKCLNCYGTMRLARAMVLVKHYPVEQVNHVRRQLEDNLRKDPKEVIRYALEQKLVQ